MQKVIEKFYSIFFENPESEEQVPYANKKFMFFFAIITFTIVLFFIIKDIVKNIKALG